MIRQAEAADEAAIRSIAEAAYAQYVPLIGCKPAPMLADFAAQITAGQVHVALDGPSALLGFITFYTRAGHMLLESVAVLPQAAGRGIGKELIAHCEAAARAQGLAEVQLYTNARMTGNLALYPRLGYRETGRRREDGFERVYFAKPLD